MSSPHPFTCRSVTGAVGCGAASHGEVQQDHAVLERRASHTPLCFGGNSRPGEDTHINSHHTHACTVHSHSHYTHLTLTMHSLTPYSHTHLTLTRMHSHSHHTHTHLCTLTHTPHSPHTHMCTLTHSPPHAHSITNSHHYLVLNTVDPPCHLPLKVVCFRENWSEEVLHLLMETLKECYASVFQKRSDGRLL